MTSLSFLCLSTSTIGILGNILKINVWLQPWNATPKQLYKTKNMNWKLLYFQYKIFFILWLRKSALQDFLENYKTT